MGGGVSLPPGQNPFLCQTSPFQAREATSAWGQHAGSPCRTAFNGAFVQGALKCAVTAGLITQVYGLEYLLEGLWVLVGIFRVISLFQLLQGSKHLYNKITL